MMKLHSLYHITAVTYDMPPQMIGVLQKLLHIRVTDCRNTVDFVICRHDRFCTAFFNAAAKRLHVIFEFIPQGYGGRCGYPVPLRIVRIKMLECCPAADILCIRTTHAPDICSRCFSGQVRILSVSLLGSAPSRVTLHINRRCPPAYPRQLLSL